MVWLVLVPFLFLPSFLFSATMEERLYSFVKSFFSDEVEVRFEPTSVLKKEGVKVKEVSFARPPSSGGGTLCVYFEEAGRTRKAFIPFQLVKKVKVLVTTRSLARGEEIGAEDVEEREILMEGGKLDLPQRSQEVVGRKVRRSLGEGQIVRFEVLEERFTVEKGELVDLIFEDERLLIRTRGKALERGRTGDMVRVKNASSGREVVGRVVATRTVSVN